MTFNVTAMRAVDLLGPQGIIYNNRPDALIAPPGGVNGVGPLVDPTALMYVLNSDIDPVTGRLKAGAPLEPLILRARAGDCILVNLTNALPADLTDTEMPGFNSMVPIVKKKVDIAVPGVGGILTFNANDFIPSSYVGLTPQLLAFDPKTNGGFSTGLTTGNLVAPGATGTYKWYAGDVTVTNERIQKNKTQFTLKGTPVEFGGLGLTASDRIKGTENGFVGAMVIEPRCSTWVEDPGTRAQATVTKGTWTGTDCDFTNPYQFRDFVTIMQNDINLRYGGVVTFIDPATGLLAQHDCAADPSSIRCAVPNIAAEGPLGPTEESQDSGQKAINYKSDPLWFRLGITPDTPFEGIHQNPALIGNIWRVYSNDLIGGVDPQTQVFKASPLGPQQGRFHVLMPGGHARGTVYTLHGHDWQRQPFVNDSSELGYNPLAEYYGSQEGVNPTGHWEFIVNLGGAFDVTGDYLWQDLAAFGKFQGLWGLLRYNHTAPDAFDAAASTPKYLCDAAGANCTAGTVDIDLTQLVFDLDGDVASYSFGQPGFGNVTDPEGDHIVTYTYPLGTTWPCLDAFACTTSFTFTATDGQGNAGSGTVFVTVTNTAPQAFADAMVIKDDVLGSNPGTVDVLLNDLDLEGDLAPARNVDVTLVTEPADPDGVPVVGGLAVVGADGRTVSYTSPIGYSGIVRIGYTVTDESGAVSNISYIRAAVNVDDVFITAARFQDVNKKWTISGTCSDPFLADGLTPNVITIYSGPNYDDPLGVVGEATCLPGDPVGTWSFSGTSTAPEPSQFTFNYVSAQSAKSGFHDGFPLTFAGPNNAPVATGESYLTDNGVLNVAAPGVLANDVDADFDPLTAVLVTNVTKGTLVLNADGSFSYQAGPAYDGSDRFSYQAFDGQDLSAPVFVNISGNVPPVAADDAYSVATSAILDVTAATGLLVNDSDVDLGTGTLEIASVNGVAANVGTGITLPSGAGLAVQVDGSFVYTSPATAQIDTFTYTIGDGLAESNTATVTIVVGSPNLPPVAMDDVFVTGQNVALTGDVKAANGNGPDVDPDPVAGSVLDVVQVNGLTANVGVLITLPSGGELTVNADGTFTYTPLFNFVGIDSFTYVLTDGELNSNEATVLISVSDTVTITSAEYRERRARWNVLGTVSSPSSTVTLYYCGVDSSCAAPVLLGVANVDPISGAWGFNATDGTLPVPNNNEYILVVSSGGGQAIGQVTVITVRR